MHKEKNPETGSATTLGKVIATIRHEIAAALDAKTPLPAGVRLEADRVVLSLRVAVKDGDRVEIVEAGQNSTETHTISIEFAIRGKEDRFDQKGAGIEAGTAEGMVNALMEVFGVPSFDSSARATVFRETFGGIPEEQARLLIASVGSASEEVAAELKTRWRMITRLLEKGPAGVERSGHVLQRIFSQHPLAPVLKIIEETWKTPEAWAQ